MHGADCPSCGTHVELDFKPVSGQVWCPNCQKLFSPPVESGQDPQKTGQSDMRQKGNGEAGDMKGTE
jgi:uncharacterized Zn finger protein (UPF0148 family)